MAFRLASTTAAERVPDVYKRRFASRSIKLLGDQEPKIARLSGGLQERISECRHEWVGSA